VSVSFNAGVCKRTCPVGAGAEDDGQCHGEAARRLEEHHRDRERADELQAVGVHKLGSVLHCGKQAGAGTEPGRPKLELWRSDGARGIMRGGGDEDRGE
jgi:hypothetical protein